MSAVLHVVSDKARHQIPLLEALVLAARGGADVLQIRDKKAPALEIYEFGQSLQSMLGDERLPSRVFVNDRLDVAMALSLSGVHLAGKSLPIGPTRLVRNRSDWKGLIGCSVHSLDEAVAAMEMGADYVTFGHVYASESHPNIAPRGVTQLARIVDAVDIPVIAIGGIDALNVGPVLETGCSGVAVIGSVLGATNPEKAAYDIKNQMVKCHRGPKVRFTTPEEV